MHYKNYDLLLVYSLYRYRSIEIAIKKRSKDMIPKMKKKKIIAKTLEGTIEKILIYPEACRKYTGHASKYTITYFNIKQGQKLSLRT